MKETRVRVNDGSFIQIRNVPIPHLQVAATSLGTADTLYTVRSDVALLVKRLAVVNTSASPVDLSLHTVPDGGASATGNAEFAALQIAANTAVDLTEKMGGYYEQGTVFKAFASTTAVLVLHGWGEEIL